MGGKKNLFFPIRQGWDSNKVAAIIDGKAYRTLGSYSIWGKGEEQHIDAIAKGRLLLEKQDENLPAAIVQVDPARMDTLIRSGKAVLVAVIPEDQQINDTINVLPHTACNVPGCNKPIQPTTPEEDTDMLFRGERESAPSPEPDTGNLQVLGTRGDTDEPDPNPYTPKLLDLKREPQDPDLEEVLNQEIRQPTMEDRILEVRLIMEEDRELREQEISGVLQIIDQGQNETRENFKIILGALNENKESFQAQSNVMKEAFTLLNRQMAKQLRALSKCISEQMAELAQEIRAAITPPPPPQAMSESFYTSPTGEVRHMTACTAEEAAETLARANAAESLAVGTIIPDSTGGTRESSPAMSPTSTTDPITTFMGGVQPVIGISEKPSRDSYVEGNSPICNLGASGTPLKYSPHGDTRTEAKPEPFRDTDTHMTNNVADCQPGLTASQHADANPRAGVAEMPGTTALGGGSEVTAPTEKELSVVARVVEAVKTKPIARSRKIQRNIQRTPALVGGFNGRFQESSRYKTPEEEEEDTSAQGSKGRQAGKAHPGTGANVTPIGPSQKPYKQSTPEKPSKRSTPGTTPPTINKATPATGANATPIGPREAAPESTPLAHGKPAEEEDSKSQGSSRHNTPEKDTRVSAFTTFANGTRQPPTHNRQPSCPPTTTAPEATSAYRSQVTIFDTASGNTGGSNIHTYTAWLTATSCVETRASSQDKEEGIGERAGKSIEGGRGRKGGGSRGGYKGTHMISSAAHAGRPDGAHNARRRRRTIDNTEEVRSRKENEVVNRSHTK
ncbi:hypothetical protein L211DRAFT_844865 [Terfezia boudieri ATCC MYA-4762]|uniref:Uncharacterized protein n=1 Tax=Terfezia boudieri ATCC MYA-4762 TaxID=1051890 RepID=A0A3N4M8D1_9PEZI|nr:hypothetical protein L211DRAFT_844865 [Terfezia boudieri ATCC MYA-4762]